MATASPTLFHADQAMKLNELNLHLMSAMPAVLLVFLLVYVYLTRKRISLQPVYKFVCFCVCVCV